MATNHGPLFDTFRADSGHPHGGARFDTDFQEQGLTAARGPLFDEFESRTHNGELHGPRYDDFEWTEMPPMHGRLFDDDFQMPAALQSDGHATWFDAFRGGAEVRCLIGGAEYEASIIDLNKDYATVKSRDGKRHEIAAGQITRWRKVPGANLGPTRRDADRPAAGMPMDAARGGAIASLNTQSIPRSDAHAPSAHSESALGGARTSAPDPGYGDTKIALKTLGFDPDEETVAKLQVNRLGGAVERHRANVKAIAAGNPGAVKCPSCGSPDAYDIGHTPAKGAKTGTSKMFGSCRGCGFKHTFPAPKIKGVRKTDESRVDVEKDVDSHETAIQGETHDDGSRYCPRCEHRCRKPRDGRCPTCGGRVTKQSPEDLDDVAKRLRGLAEVG